MGELFEQYIRKHKRESTKNTKREEEVGGDIQIIGKYALANEETKIEESQIGDSHSDKKLK